MNENDLTAEEQREIEEYLNHPTLKNAEVMHYRGEDVTHLNTDWLYTDLSREGSSEVVVTWLRLITGPEATPDGVKITEELRDYVDRRGAVFDDALAALEEFGAIRRDGDLITFPNLIWGDPPEEADEEEGE